MHVAHQEHAAAEVRHQSLQRRAVESLARRRARQAFDHARLVALRLQAADEPGARVGQSAIVEVHRILRRQHDAESERAGLLEQGQHRRLRRRVGRGREIAEDLVHVEQRAQRRGARLPARPREHFVQQHRHEEHPFGVAQVRDGQNGNARLAFRRVEQPLHVQRLAFGPRGKSRRRGQVVQAHRQREAVLGREERFQRQDADALHARFLYRLDERQQVEIPPGAPFAIDDGGKQNVFARLERIGLHADERQQAGHGRGRAVAQRGIVGGEACRRRGERRQDRQRQTGAGAGRVDREVGGGFQAANARAVLAPALQPARPGFRRLDGALVHVHLLARGFAFVHPRAEIRRRELRKRQQQVAHVALGIDDDGGDAVERGLLDQADAQAGLAGAGHADAHRVGGQVLRFVEQRFFRRFPRLGIEDPAQIEHAQFFEIDHDGLLPTAPAF